METSTERRSKKRSRPSPTFNCPICKDIAIDPKVSSKCGHSFCSFCVEKFIHDHKTCPICYSIGTFVPNYALREMLETKQSYKKRQKQIRIDEWIDWKEKHIKILKNTFSPPVREKILQRIRIAYNNAGMMFAGSFNTELEKQFKSNGLILNYHIHADSAFVIPYGYFQNQLFIVTDNADTTHRRRKICICFSRQIPLFN